MSYQDPVCKRIIIPGKADGSHGSSNHPPWTPEVLDRIYLRWPLCYHRVMGLRADENATWHIVPPRDDKKPQIVTDEWVQKVVDRIGDERVQTAHKECFPALSLSNHCSGLEYLGIRPNNYPVEWRRTMCEGMVVYNDGRVVDPTRDTDQWPPAPLTHRSLSSGCLSVSELVWNSTTSPWSVASSLQLANIALSLGPDWDEVSKREIKALIWNWEDTAVSGSIVIPCLQRERLERKPPIDEVYLTESHTRTIRS